MNDSPQKSAAYSAKQQDKAASDKTRLSTRQLFGTRNEIILEHQGEEYHLRITRNGKLILTK